MLYDNRLNKLAGHIPKLPLFAPLSREMVRAGDLTSIC